MPSSDKVATSDATAGVVSPDLALTLVVAEDSFASDFTSVDVAETDEPKVVNRGSHAGDPTA